jgi:hypothetical protein
MKIKILLFAVSALTIASCSTAYKNTQTPDDVYYSPVRPIVEDNKKEENDQVDNGTANEVREIRMQTYDRRWRDLDRDYDYDYSYHPYKYGYTYGYYYNPYYYNYPVYLPGTVYVNPKNTTARMTNLGGYNTTTTTGVNPKTGKRETITTGGSYNNNNRSVIRQIFTGLGNGNNNNTNTNNTRTYSPSTNNNSSSSGTKSAGSGTSVSRPTRGN